MLTEFQIKKLTKIFNVLDINHDSKLSLEDFQEASSRFIKIHKLPDTAHKTNDLKELYINVWVECVQKPAHINKEESIDLKKWLDTWTSLVSVKAGHDDVNYIGEMFYESLDIDHNRRVTIEEFTILHQVFELHEEAMTKQVFELMDMNHNGSLSKDEIVEALNQFFFSEKKDAPGNFIFGKI